MLNAYFGDIGNGRIQRLAYLGHSVLLAVCILAFVFAVVAAIAGAETALGGDLAEAQNILRRTLSIPLLIVFAIFIFIVLFAGANIAAKRIRDIGFPGWAGVIGIVVLTGAVSIFVSQNASHAISTLSWLGLLLIPGGVIKRD